MKATIRVCCVHNVIQDGLNNQFFGVFNANFVPKIA